MLKDKIESATFEPHPASGEIEVGDTHEIKYKRFDEETLRAQISLVDWPFTALYLWCTGSDEGNAWKLAELLPSDHDLQNDSSWSTSIAEANESSKERLVNEALKEAEDAVNVRSQRNLSVSPNEDDYWAMYDNTPSRTPARKESVQPPREGHSDDDYYARYGSVQPAMDNHDPDEEMESSQEPRLNGHALQQMLSSHQQPRTDSDPPPYQGGITNLTNDPEDIEVEVNHPVPSSPSSRGSDAVARLEEHAERYGASEIGIRQHISTSMKSMYRLARSAGISRVEFERMMQRELETLSLLDLDE